MLYYSGLFLVIYMCGMRCVVGWLTGVFLLCGIHAQAQKQGQWHLVYSTTPSLVLPVTLKNASVDSVAGLRRLKDTVLKLHRKGYLTASADSIQWENDTLHAFLHIGRVFRWVSLQPGNADQTMLRAIGFREKLYRHQRLNPLRVAELEEKILRYSDEHGYPFARIGLDSVQISEKGISATLNHQPGIRIVLDTMRIVGSAKLRRKFLENWLRLNPGQPYSQSRLDQAFNLLSRQPYLTLTRPYEVVFKNERAYITVYADAGKSSEADGIVGFQPNEQENGRLLLTGELNLRLRNLFASGGSFAFNWQQIRRGSPRLFVNYSQPAFLGTPLELSGSFQLLREDSAQRVRNGFVTLSQQANVFYNLGGYSRIGIGVERRTSRLADSTRKGFENEILPREANTNWLSYNIQYSYTKLDDFFYPRRGLSLTASVAAGNKQIIADGRINAQTPGLQLTSPQVMCQAMLRKYTRLGRRATLLSQITAGQLLNANLFQNDLFRLGGLTTLRGFNENFFFASGFAAATLEYRFFWEPTSYLFLFYDQAWLQTRVLREAVRDAPSGVGAGFSFSTKAGVFNIAYALGSSRDRTLGLNFSKIHFGLVARF